MPFKQVWWLKLVTVELCSVPVYFEFYFPLFEMDKT